MQPMPGFAGKLGDEQLTDLLNYLRQGWGGQSGDLAVSNVQKLRADAPPLEHKAH
jgi:mono/diheme cytochrome c family protein